MKHQYFGDINDYRKYGLLRILTGKGELRSFICWMLTPNDDRPDGSRTAYLKEPKRHRHFDEDLFDFLGDCDQRHTKHIEGASILANTTFYNKFLTDEQVKRERYFLDVMGNLKGTGLIFFDPDNGMEVKSKPYGRKHSCKYLYWPELKKAYSTGSSVLVYQHFRRVKRDLFIKQMSREMQERTGAVKVYAFRTPHVVFFLLSQPANRKHFDARLSGLEVWGEQLYLVAGL